MPTSWARTHNRGFSLVELLTVIAIIALIISILLPVLGRMRDTGKNVATAGVLNDLAGATAQFRGDHQDRNPGYFSAREMGSTDNATRGMSEMENVLLDLAGKDAIVASATASTVQVGPIASSAINVDPSLIGATGSYFTPSGEFYTAQLASTDQQASNVAGHAGSSEDDVQLLDMVDAFGQPLLFWSADSYTMNTVNDPADFARVDSGPAANPSLPALYYWNSNAAFLSASNLGRKGEDMTADMTAGKFSLIGSGMSSNANMLLSMQALLGSPSAPAVMNGSVETALGLPSEANIEALFPRRGKGAFTIHSAGLDGIYLSSSDKGFKSSAHEDDHIDYGLNFFAGISARYTDDDGKPTSRDIISEFDDITVSGGG